MEADKRLRELVAKWRKNWAEASKAGAACCCEVCADELDAALGELPTPQRLTGELLQDANARLGYPLHVHAAADKDAWQIVANLLNQMLASAHTEPAVGVQREALRPKLKCCCQPIHSQECVFRDVRSNHYRHFMPSDYNSASAPQEQKGTFDAPQIARDITVDYDLHCEDIDDPDPAWLEGRLVDELKAAYSAGQSAASLSEEQIAEMKKRFFFTDGDGNLMPISSPELFGSMRRWLTDVVGRTGTYNCPRCGLGVPHTHSETEPFPVVSQPPLRVGELNGILQGYGIKIGATANDVVRDLNDLLRGKTLLRTQGQPAETKDSGSTRAAKDGDAF